MEKLVSSEEIEKKALELVKIIKEDSDYREYLKLKEQVKDNKDIMEKIAKIKKLQKDYVKSAYLDNNIKKMIDEEFEKLNTIELYKEYNNKQKKFNNLFINMQEGLNIIFDDILNNRIP